MPQSNKIVWCTFIKCTILFTSFFLLIQSAHASDNLKEISELREWSVLLHYNKGLANTRSLIDDKDFFISENGKYDKYAELQALYNALYSDNKIDNIACKFPARSIFLATHLNLPIESLNLSECTDLNDFLQQIASNKVSIIFPFYQMNGPASMFGHTLIRFDNSDDSLLTSSAVTYSADYNKKDNGFTYALKGTTGLYQGRYQILPYHEKIKEYDNMNQRDIWEYELNLSHDEIEKMIYHVYEIKDIWSRYYFFDENCSYNILFLIEAAKPTLHLTDQFLWVTPIDTLVLLKENGLISTTNFRASQSSRMLNMLEKMDKKVYLIATDSMKNGELADYQSLTDDEKATLIDFWIEYIMFTYRSQDRKVYISKLYNVLLIRSKIHSDNVYSVKTPINPLEGHKTSRVKMSSGSDNGKKYFELNWHPAIHNLEDSDNGYLAGSSFMFADTTIRYYENDLILDKFSFVDIYSLAPVNVLFNPVSWKVSFGIEHNDDYNNYSFFLRPAVGKAFNYFGGIGYGLIGVASEANDNYLNNSSFNLDIDTGYIFEKKKYKLLISYNRFINLASDDIYNNKFKFVTTYNLGSNKALNLKYEWSLDDRYDAQGGLMFYY